MRLKRRTREHVIADLSSNFVERQVLLCGYTAERSYFDYGIDLTIRTYNPQGEVESGFIFVQLKATDHLALSSKAQTIPWTIDARDLRAWLAETLPYILVLYDAKEDTAYWLYIQAYFSTKSDFDLNQGAKTVTVHLKPENKVNSDAIKKMAQYKSSVIQQLKGEITYADQ
jgi:hypothetical protein